MTPLIGEGRMSSTNEQQEKVLPTWALWLILLVVIGGMTFAITEVALRVIPGSWSSSFFHTYDPLVGTRYIPNMTGTVVHEDYIVHGLSINSHGYHDRERTFEKPEDTLRIAFIGDSFTSGMQVVDEQNVTRRMETIFAEKGYTVEVLNFGQGGFGTLQELLTYQEDVRKFSPDVVIIGFLSQNDMINNSKEFEILTNGTRRFMPFLVKDDEDGWELDPTPEKVGSQNSLVLFAKRNFATYRFLWPYKHAFVSWLKRDETVEEVPEAKEEEQNPHAYAYGLFGDPGDDASYLLAWETTEELMRRMVQETKLDRVPLVVATFPSVAHMEPDPRGTLEEEFGPLPENFDIDYPEARINTLSERLGFLHIDLTPGFRAYRDQEGLERPYFSWPHDGHYTELGYNKAAEIIVEELLAENLGALIEQ